MDANQKQLTPSVRLTALTTTPRLGFPYPGAPRRHTVPCGPRGDNHPSKSLLLLHDHQQNPLNIASLAPIALDRARLAYLSACSTAFTSTTELLDEATHLASAFQLAGFPHVIGTLWEINDDIAVTIAETFYTKLTTSQDACDTDQAARALHDAIRAVRTKFPVTPSLWAAYLHSGA